eukprot:TRINITY_DN15465_c0_g1_i1.p1 TRINITY_DN15465_c0_g1~~TRINITY_DN15465_c0_g1_i1.p1  ORF type:complete len:871 (-),score=150.37 TRINITY_DN15465_c0_g1_i1:92-2704(-)
MSFSDVPADVLDKAGDEGARGVCAFHCLGCSGISSPAHEAQALADHVRLLLREVIALRTLVSTPKSAAVNGVSVAPAQAKDEHLNGDVCPPSAPPVLRRTSRSVSGAPQSWPWPGSAPPVPPSDQLSKDKSECDLLQLLDGSLPVFGNDCGVRSDDHCKMQAIPHLVAIPVSDGATASASVGDTAVVAEAEVPTEPTRLDGGVASPPPSPPPPPSPSEAESPSSPQARCSLLFGDADASQASRHGHAPAPCSPQTSELAGSLKQDTCSAKTLFMGVGDGGNARSNTSAAAVDVAEGVGVPFAAVDGVRLHTDDVVKETSAVSVAAPTSAPKSMAAPVDRGIADAEAHRTLTSVTADLQSGKLPHAEAAENFTSLIRELPPGKLRSSALLNRAHCLVGLGRYSAALLDIDAIAEERSHGFDAWKWHKVWLSRGGIHRKLAQKAERGEVDGPDSEAGGGGCGEINGGGILTADARVAMAHALYAKARADYEHVLAIDPPHAGYTEKARRCLALLSPLHRTPDRSADICEGGDVACGAVGKSCMNDAAPLSMPFAEVDSIALTKRRRLQSPSRDELARPSMRDAVGAGNDLPTASVAARSAPHDGASAIDPCAVASRAETLIDAAFARSALAVLGRDCSLAGLSLFRDGSVREREEHPVTSLASAACATALGVPACSSDPQRRCRRVFEIRTALGGIVETVVLQGGAPATGSTAVTGAISTNKIGECSCRLRGHCKHVAAALCAVEQDQDRKEGGSMLLASDGMVLPSASALSRSDRDALERRLERRTIDELKHCLRLNNQLVGGTKPELLRRVADGVVFGALPPCPQCGGHFHTEGGRFRCRKPNREKEPCGFEATLDELETKPFKGVEQFL